MNSYSSTRVTRIQRGGIKHGMLFEALCCHAHDLAGSLSLTIVVVVESIAHLCAAHWPGATHTERERERE